MKLVDRYGWRTPKPDYSIATAVEIACASQADGQVEMARDVADNASRKLGDLVEMLHTKAVLTDDDVLCLLSGFELKKD